MTENNFAALMIKRALTTSEEWDGVILPGIYPTPAGHTSAPDANSGVLIVLPPSTNPAQHFISSTSVEFTRCRTANVWSAWFITTQTVNDKKPDNKGNIKLGAAAGMDVGTTAGTVAAGDDSRIVDAISSKNTHVQLPGALTAGSDIRAARFLSKSDVVAGEGRAEGHATLAVDGNVHGTVWGGALSTYIGNMRNTALKDWNGWFRDASTGLITQWCTGGGVTHETQNIITYFPMAFPNACLMAHVSTKSPDQNFDNDVFYQTAAWNNTYVVTMLQRPAGARAGTNVYPLFIAIGY